MLDCAAKFGFSYQSATAAHSEGTFNQGDGLGDSSHSGYHLGLLSNCDCTRFVHSDDGPCGGGRRRRHCAHLGCSCLQHPGSWITDLGTQHYLNDWHDAQPMFELRTFDRDVYHYWRCNFYCGCARGNGNRFEDGGTWRNIEDSACRRGWNLLCGCSSSS